MSPELFKYKPYSYKSDIWALGCIMYEICNLKHAFDAQNLNGLAIKILKGNFTPMNSMYSKNLRTLVEQMLNTKPANRPSIEEILNKPFIKKKLVGYVIYLFQHEQQDYDLYLDTVKQQCKALGIWDLVDKYMHKKIEKLSNSDFLSESVATKKPSNNTLREQKNEQEAKLRNALTEQDKLEDELKKLETLKQSKEFQAMGNKEKVLLLKKMKKLSDLTEKNQQLEEFRKSNQDSGIRNKKAGDKNRDSHQIKNLMGNKGMETVDEYDDEDFEDPDKLKQIREEDEEEDIDERIKKYKQRKENNSQNIESLREELKKTTQK